MIAQASGTLCHIPVLFQIMHYLPNNPVLAIALTNSTSSLFKLVVIVLIGRFHDDIRNSIVPFSWTHDEGS